MAVQQFLSSILSANELRYGSNVYSSHADYRTPIGGRIDEDMKVTIRTPYGASPRLRPAKQVYKMFCS